MALDIRTLFAVLGVMLVLSSSALLFTWWLNRTISGVRMLAFGQLILSLGIILIMLRGIIAPEVSVSVGNGGLILGYMMLYGGIRCFLMRRPIPTPLIVGVALAATVLSVYFHFVMDSPLARMVFMFGLIIVLCLAIAREYMRADALRTPATVLVGGLWLVHALVNLFQVVGLLWAPVAGVMESAGYTQIMMMESIVLTVAFALGVIIMTTDRLQADLAHQAAMDPLTEVFNRRAFFSSAESALLRAERAGAPVSVLVMDLDHFKNVNDTFGHAAGDKVLCHFAAMAQASLRGGDILGRFGGEEFIALLPDADADQATRVAERLREGVSRSSIDCDGVAVRITVSIGVAMCSDRSASLEKMVKCADEALYEAKEKGRNRVVLHAA